MNGPLLKYSLLKLSEKLRGDNEDNRIGKSNGQVLPNWQMISAATVTDTETTF